MSRRSLLYAPRTSTPAWVFANTNGDWFFFFAGVFFCSPSFPFDFTGAIPKRPEAGCRRAGPCTRFLLPSSSSPARAPPATPGAASCCLEPDARGLLASVGGHWTFRLGIACCPGSPACPPPGAWAGQPLPQLLSYCPVRRCSLKKHHVRDRKTFGKVAPWRGEKKTTPPLVPIPTHLPRVWRPHPCAGRRTCPCLPPPSSASASRAKCPPRPKPLPVVSSLDRIDSLLPWGSISLPPWPRGAEPPRGRSGAVALLLASGPRRPTPPTPPHVPLPRCSINHPF